MRKLSERLPFMFTPQVLLYLPMLAAALLLAQGVKIPITYTVFLFVLFLPVGSLIQLIIARLTVKVSFRVSKTVTRKFVPILLNVVVKNRGLLPFSPIEAVLALPIKDGSRVEDTRFMLSLMPLSACNIEQSAVFAFRGEYKIGIRCIYIYDFMHIMRIRIPINLNADIFVSPRYFELESEDNVTVGDSDSASDLHLPHGHGTELADIRLYNDGDSQKHIHWKLSTKSDELLVKDFATQNENTVAVLCDFEPVSAASSHRTIRPEYADTADLHCADCVVETALAVIRRELDAGNTVMLGWFENGYPVFASLHRQSNTGSLYRRFVCATSDDTPHQIIRLSEETHHRHASKLIIISPTTDNGYAEDYIIAAESMEEKCLSTLYLCAPHQLFEDTDSDSSEADERAQLQASGIRVTIPQNATL